MMALIVEDCSISRASLERAVSGICEQLFLASSLAEARRCLETNQPDLILLDLSLADGEGIQLLPLLNGWSSVVIFVSSRQELSAKLSAFSLGAEDYITKPFHPLEVRARVALRLRKLVPEPTPLILKKGPFEIDLSARVTYLCSEGRRVALPLTQKEFGILVHLSKKEEQVYSRDEILDAVWVGTEEVLDRTIDRHICSLRKKLGAGNDYIQSVRGTGYKFKLAPMPGEGGAKSGAVAGRLSKSRR